MFIFAREVIYFIYFRRRGGHTSTYTYRQDLQENVTNSWQSYWILFPQLAGWSYCKSESSFTPHSRFQSSPPLQWFSSQFSLFSPPCFIFSIQVTFCKDACACACACASHEHCSTSILPLSLDSISLHSHPLGAMASSEEMVSLPIIPSHFHSQCIDMSKNWHTGMTNVVRWRHSNSS